MANENTNLEFGEKHKSIFLFFISAVSGYVSISECALLVGIPVVITSSGVRLEICAITAGIKNYKSIIRKKRKKHDKIVLLEKAKLDTIGL